MENNKVLHFDVSLGCTAEVLIGALVDLVGNVDCVKQGFEACDIDGIEPSMERSLTKGGNSVVINFQLESGDALNRYANKICGHTPRLPKRATDRKPIWARTNRQNSKNAPVNESSEGSCVNLTDIRNIILNSTLPPISMALAVKVVDILIENLNQSSSVSDTSSTFSKGEIFRYLCEIVSFSQLIAKLDPSSVTASRIAFSSPTTSLYPDWILTLSKDLPTLDRMWPAPYCDAVGLAILRAVVSRYGARGESTLLRHGVGANSLNAGPMLTARALLCALPQIDSRADISPGPHISHTPYLEISATLGQGIDVADLLRRLTGLGMKSVFTWQAFEASTFPRLLLRGCMPATQSHLGIEALLVTGEATEVFTHVVETQTLQHRIVAVPYGRGQTQQTCKITEWLWGSKILRADPDAKDLAQLVSSTGFSQEVVRADVLASWRKWRPN